MTESTLRANGKTTIPKAVREILNLKTGDRIRYEIDEHGVRLVPLKPAHLLAGLLRYDGDTKTLEEMEHGIVRGATDC